MLFLAIGFGFLTIGPFVLWLLGAGIGQRMAFDPDVYPVYVPIVSWVLEITD